MTKMSADEKRWRAQADADTMARYNEIMSDASRRKAAQAAAKEQAARLQKQAAAMSKAAGSKK